MFLIQYEVDEGSICHWQAVRVMELVEVGALADVLVYKFIENFIAFKLIWINLKLIRIILVLFDLFNHFMFLVQNEASLCNLSGLFSVYQ